MKNIVFFLAIISTLLGYGQSNMKNRIVFIQEIEFSPNESCASCHLAFSSLFRNNQNLKKDVIFISTNQDSATSIAFLGNVLQIPKNQIQLAPNNLQTGLYLLAEGKFSAITLSSFPDILETNWQHLLHDNKNANQIVINPLGQLSVYEDIAQLEGKTVRVNKATNTLEVEGKIDTISLDLVLSNLNIQLNPTETNILKGLGYHRVKIYSTSITSKSLFVHVTFPYLEKTTESNHDLYEKYAILKFNTALQLVECRDIEEPKNLLFYPGKVKHIDESVVLIPTSSERSKNLWLTKIDLSSKGTMNVIEEYKKVKQKTKNPTLGIAWNFQSDTINFWKMKNLIAQKRLISRIINQELPFDSDNWDLSFYYQEGKKKIVKLKALSASISVILHFDNDEGSIRILPGEYVILNYDLKENLIIKSSENQAFNLKLKS